jgi:hypothetical protein
MFGLNTHTTQHSLYVVARTHTHSHTHNTLACRHTTGLLFSCQSYLVLITCLELFHAAIEQERTRYTSCLLLVHQHSGGMMSRALRETMLTRATAICFNIDPLHWLLWKEVQDDTQTLPDNTQHSHKSSASRRDFKQLSQQVRDSRKRAADARSKGVECIWKYGRELRLMKPGGKSNICFLGATAPCGPRCTHSWGF